MIVVAWIFFVVFGLLSILFLRKLLLSRVNLTELITMLLSIVLYALSAGYLFGGLFQ